MQAFVLWALGHCHLHPVCARSAASLAFFHQGLQLACCRCCRYSCSLAKLQPTHCHPHPTCARSAASLAFLFVAAAGAFSLLAAVAATGSFPSACATPCPALLVPAPPAAAAAPPCLTSPAVAPGDGCSATLPSCRSKGDTRPLPSKGEDRPRPAKPTRTGVTLTGSVPALAEDIFSWAGGDWSLRIQSTAAEMQGRGQACTRQCVPGYWDACVRHVCAACVCVCEEGRPRRPLGLNKT